MLRRLSPQASRCGDSANGGGEVGGHGRQHCARPSAPPQIPSRSGEMQRTGVAVAEDDGKGERCRPARSFETPPRPDPSPPGSSGRAGRSVLADEARREGLWGLGRAPLHSSVAPGGRRSVWRKGTSSPHSVLRDAARSNHPPTAPQDEREGGEVYVGPDASTGSRHRRVAAATARTGGGGRRALVEA